MIAKILCINIFCILYNKFHSTIIPRIWTLYTNYKSTHFFHYKGTIQFDLYSQNLESWNVFSKTWFVKRVRFLLFPRYIYHSQKLHFSRWRWKSRERNFKIAGTFASPLPPFAPSSPFRSSSSSSSTSTLFSKHYLSIRQSETRLLRTARRGEGRGAEMRIVSKSGRLLTGHVHRKPREQFLRSFVSGFTNRCSLYSRLALPAWNLIRFLQIYVPNCFSLILIYKLVLFFSNQFYFFSVVIPRFSSLQVFLTDRL